MAAMERDATGRHSLAGPDGPQRQQLHGTEDVLTRTSLLGSSANLARQHEADVQPLLPAMLDLEATRGLQTPTAACRPVYSAQKQASSRQSLLPQQQQHVAQSTPLSRDGRSQKLPVLSGLSRVHTLLRTPTLLSGSSPLQPWVLPRLMHASACGEAQKTPVLASKLSTAQQHPSHQTPGITPQQRQPAACDSTAKIGARDRLYRADSAAGARSPMAVTIPRLKSAPAACVGQSPLAFPALSPAAAQPAGTPQIRPDQPATNSGGPGRLSVTPLVAQQTPKQQEASGGPLCAPLLQSSNAARAAAWQQQADASMHGVVVNEGLGFGSPLLIEDTPQDRHNQGRHKPAAALDYAEVPPCDSPAPTLCAQCPSPAAAPEGAQTASGQNFASRAGLRSTGTTTAAQHLPGSTGGESNYLLKRTATAQEHAPRHKRRRRKGAAAQQENAGTAHQQAAGASEQRQALAPKNAAALGNAEGSEEGTRGRKRQRSEQQARKRDGVRKMQKTLGACMETHQPDAKERSHSASSMRGGGETQEKSLGNTPRCSGRCQAASQHIASAKGAAVLCLSSGIGFITITFRNYNCGCSSGLPQT